MEIKLIRAIHNKHRGLMTSYFCMTTLILTPFKKKKICCFHHLPYSLDLVHTDFHIFMHIKKWFESQYFHGDEELENPRQQNFMKKLVHFYNKYIHINENYIEKELKEVDVNCI